MKLVGRLANVADLTGEQHEQMFALMDRHYRNVRRDTFEHDLAEKQWVILVQDPASGALHGFSTQVMLEAEHGGRPVRALFSGDTIIDRHYWGDNALAHVWGRLALALIDAHPGEELFWFLISKGYKTYRFLPLFFREFYPRPGMATPRWALETLEALGRSRYPDAFDAATGIIHSTADKECLHADIAPITDERMRDPYVRFFAERNPGHGQGDELCCLAPLSRANFTRAAYRVIGPEPALAGALP